MKQMLGTIVAFLAALGTALPITPGTAHAMDGLSIQIGGKKAQFVNGALLGIPVVYTCPVGSTFPSLSVEVHQASGNEVVNGFGVEEALVCDGKPRETMVFVKASNSSPFRRSKDVVVDVNVSVCDELMVSCGNASDGPKVMSLKR